MTVAVFSEANPAGKLREMSNCSVAYGLSNGLQQCTREKIIPGRVWGGGRNKMQARRALPTKDHKTGASLRCIVASHYSNRQIVIKNTTAAIDKEALETWVRNRQCCHTVEINWVSYSRGQHGVFSSSLSKLLTRPDLKAGRWPQDSCTGGHLDHQAPQTVPLGERWTRLGRNISHDANCVIESITYDWEGGG